MSLLIKNGTIATASDTYKADIYIENGVIRYIGENIEEDADEVVDAKGKYVIPGGVDVHTHFNLDVGIAVANDDFYTGTIAAACGGTTTIVDHMGFGPKGCDLKHQVDLYHKYADGNSVIDYSFHGVIQHIDKNILEEMKRIFEDEGVASEGLKTPVYHCLSRPEEAEGEAVNRMINIAKIADDAPLYVVHLSTKLGLDYIKIAREKGQKVYAETCPQYLILDKSKYELPNNEGLKYIMSPPLREKNNCNELWKGINDGYIQTIATDHCPFSFNKEKQMGKDDFTKCPNGAPGVEERIPLIFSEGVMKKKISIN